MGVAKSTQFDRTLKYRNGPNLDPIWGLFLLEHVPSMNAVIVVHVKKFWNGLSFFSAVYYTEQCRNLGQFIAVNSAGISPSPRPVTALDISSHYR